MPILNVKIPEELDRKFRLVLTEKFGGRKGDLQKAVLEALESYVNQKPLENLVRISRDVKAPKEARDNAMSGLRHSGIFGLQALTEIGADPNMDEFGRDVATAEAKSYLRARETIRGEARHPTLVREEYGPQNARTVVEKDYRRSSRPK